MVVGHLSQASSSMSAVEAYERALFNERRIKNHIKKQLNII